MIGFDTNLVIRLMVEDDAAQAQRARTLLEEAAERDEPVLISDIVLSELEWVLEAAYKVPRQRVLTALHILLADDRFCFEDRHRVATALNLYQQGKGDLADYLIGLRSDFHTRVSRREGAYLAEVQELGRGVTQGTLDGFPTFFIDLTQLPIEPAALPLLMVAKGPRERELVEFVIDHYREYPQYVRFLQELHIQILREVLRMKQLTPEQIGIDYQALLELIGEERAIDLIGEERLLEDLLRRKGEQWVRARLERHTPPPEASETSA